MKHAAIFILSMTISTLFPESSTVSASFITRTIFNAVEKAGSIAGNVIGNANTAIQSAGQAAAEKAAEDIDTLKEAGEVISNKIGNVGNTVKVLTNNIADVVGKTVNHIQTKATEDLQFFKDGASQLAHDVKLTLAVETLKNVVAGVKKAVEIASNTNDGDAKYGLLQLIDWLNNFENLIASILTEPKDVVGGSSTTRD